MNPVIRRLALDLSPWIWAFILYSYAIGILIDIFWLNRPFAGDTPLMVSFFFSIGMSISMQKVALWRTLPVSQRQIDLARWAQGISFPLVSLSLMMLLPALVMWFLGILHARWPYVLLMIGAQAGSSTILFATIVGLPLLARWIGGWSMLIRSAAIFPIAFAPFWIGRASGYVPVLPLLAVLGFAAALLLYASAGRWPLPIIGWAALWSARETKTRPGNPGLSGWPALLLAQMPMVLICWCLIPALPLVMRLALRGNMDMSSMATTVLLTCGLLPATVFALSMRGLRALPLSGLALTTRIVTSLVTIQLIGAVIFALTLALLQPGYPPRPNYALLPVALPVLLFALTLRFGPRVAQFGVAIAIVSVFLGAVLLGSLDFSVADTAFAVVMLTGLGFAATYREIVSGRHAYRAQPLVPLSWRGR